MYATAGGETKRGLDGEKRQSYYLRLDGQSDGGVAKGRGPAVCAAEPLENHGIAIELQQAFVPIGQPLVGTGAGVPELWVRTTGTTTMGMTARMPMVIAAPLPMW